jgi:TetR/AcrR family transcriptional regulator, regulator of autoinduction and epiphytic fitness
MTAVESTDGRVARGARNRVALVDALLELLREGEPRPRAREIADRAGLSLRTVFQHFEDLEALYAMAADRQTEHLAARFGPLAVDGATADRVTALVERRAALFEEVAQVRRASLLVAPSSPVLTERLARAAARLSRESARVLAPELDSLPPKRRADVLTAVDLALSWEAWDALRRVQGLPATAAQRVTQLVVEQVVAGR